MAVAKSESAVEIQVVEVTQDQAVFRMIGTTPLIIEAVGQKARRELLLPRGRKNATEKATTLKHIPYEEFISSTYRIPDSDAPTVLGIPATGIKNAIRSAALDLTGVSKTEIGRLTYVAGDLVPVWGVPKLLMSIVRSADMNKTPDIRTRPILPQWAMEITVYFVRPKMTEQALSRLLVAAGITIGIGGWRQEKGSGNYGLFKLATPDDLPDFERIVNEGGRVQQQDALAHPACYNTETSELLAWWEEEVANRRKKGGAGAVLADTVEALETYESEQVQSNGGRVVTTL